MRFRTSQPTLVRIVSQEECQEPRRWLAFWSTTIPVLRRYLALIAVKSLLLLACTGSAPTKIKDILDHPREYDGRTVVISGEVKERTNLLVVKYFVVKDDTGEMTVITERAVPNPGERVRVKGRVNQAFAMGGRSIVVVVEQSGS